MTELTPRTSRRGPGRRWRHVRIAATAGALAVSMLAVTGGGAQAASEAKQPPGVTDTVTVGFLYARSQAAQGAATGVATPADIETEAIVQLLIDNLNKNGGLLGKQVKVVFGTFNSGASSWAAEYQTACSKFTQDNKTWWVFSNIALGPTTVLAQCLKDAKTILQFDNGGPSMVQKSYDKFVPYLYSPSHLYQDRYGELIALAAKSQPGFFKGAKFGVLYLNNEDTPATVTSVIEPALKKTGAQVVDKQALSQADSTQGLNSNAQLLTNALLHFKTTGVTHVFLVGGAGGSTLTFWSVARAQSFTPKVLMTTENLPNTQATGTAAQVEQLKGTIGIGWSPAQDVNDLTGAATPNGTACLDQIKAGGYNVTVRTDGMLQMCDWVNFMAATTKASKSFQASKINAAYHKASLGFKASRTFESAAKSGRSDGAASAQVFLYDEACRCMKYTGKPEKVGSSK